MFVIPKKLYMSKYQDSVLTFTVYLSFASWASLGLGTRGHVPGVNASVPWVNFCWMPDSMLVCNKDKNILKFEA